jgi:RNA polymerase primary sigma factor
MPRAEARHDLEDEQRQVMLARNGDRDVADRLVASSLPFVAHIAREFRGRGVPIEDLIAEGCLGLLRAIHGYRADSGTRFMTYASYWVRKRILLAVVDQAHPIHVPRYARQRGFATPRLVRFDGPAGADGGPGPAGRLRHPDPLPADAVIAAQQLRALRRHLLRLGLRERAVLVWRYGLGGEPQRTLHEIGFRLGISRERVRQIEVEALSRLRTAIGIRRRGLPALKDTASRDA